LNAEWVLQQVRRKERLEIDKGIESNQALPPVVQLRVEN